MKRVSRNESERITGVRKSHDSSHIPDRHHGTSTTPPDNGCS